MPEPRARVLIVGAGPAGLAAARAALDSGADVSLLDQHESAGGQIWRANVAREYPAAAKDWLVPLRRGECTWLPGRRVFARAGRSLLVEGASGAERIAFERLIIATGARELLLPFPGWTLPGVTGAGGLQALVKGGWPIRNRRVVVAGSGPLLLAAADTVRAAGGRLVAIVEHASRAALAGFALALLRHPAKLAQAIALRARLREVPYLEGGRVLAGIGQAQLHGVRIADAKGERDLACDALAVGYGLVPNTELAELLGCELDRSGAHPTIRVDALQATSLPDVYAAGEGTGIGGVERALAEGRIAGHAAADDSLRARQAFGARRHAHHFANALARCFAPAPDLAGRLRPDTIICRCEDVPWRALDPAQSWRARKLETRCGMGWCQGRICGAALATLGLPTAAGVRPPLHPARVGSWLIGADAPDAID